MPTRPSPSLLAPAPNLMAGLHLVEEGARSGSLDLPTIDEPIKPRPWSSQGLSPSPIITENKRCTKDDGDIRESPVQHKRLDYGSRGLSLQMPSRDLTSTSTANLSSRGPVSPKPDTPSFYPSPTSVLPRRSRGLDFSRAATNLHHSILADRPSPEASPSTSARRAMNIPGRKGFCSPPDAGNVPESPRSLMGAPWANCPSHDRPMLSSSLGSSAIYDNDSDSSSSEDMMDMGEDEDTIHGTPQNGFSLVNPFGTPQTSPGGDVLGAFTPSSTKLLSYQRARLQSRRQRTRGSSSSASGQSNMQSPMPPSPPLLRSIETGLGMGGIYYLEDSVKKEIDSRRESLSLGTSDMRLSDAEHSGDEIPTHNGSILEGPIMSLVSSNVEDRKLAVRRAVNRRSNMLPKSKGFARIKAALLEEGSPIDTDLRKEADVIRQVREGDANADLNPQRSQPTTTASSPSLGPITAGPSDAIEGLPSDFSTSSEGSSRRPSSTAFTNQASRHSGGVAFWNQFDERIRTPPPQTQPRTQSSGISEDFYVEGNNSSTPSMTPLQNGVQRTASHDSASSTVFEIPRKGNKRMRDDDLDPVYFKRRAVSPSLSVQNSPILPQSPGWWGTPKRDERVCSNGSSASGNGAAGKRVGMQGMNDTSDGLMNMSIE